jgi:Hint domain
LRHDCIRPSRGVAVMSWIYLSDPGGALRPEMGRDGDVLLPRGSLVVETGILPGKRPQSLIHYDCAGDWPMHLSLQSIPGGGISLVLDQGGTTVHGAISQPQEGRLDTLRITYSWDAPRRWGRLALESTEGDRFALVAIHAPQPLRLQDLRALTGHGPGAYVAPDVSFIAVSGGIEPVGPMPTLTPDTPIATPGAFMPAGALRRGDLVLTAAGETVPVLHSISRTVPARGSFRPVRMRAPYFGLQQDIVVSPAQRLVISGSVVDYMFATEAVLVNARHLIGGTAATRIDDPGPLITYVQLLLPGHEALIAAGTVLESLHIGRLRRQKARLAASLLAGLDRSRLPEHGRSVHPVLRAFDALVLAEQRAA